MTRAIEHGPMCDREIKVWIQQPDGSSSCMDCEHILQALGLKP